MHRQKLLSLLGLAQKAGKLVSGEFAIAKAVKARRANLILVAVDSSENTKKEFRRLAEIHRISYVEQLTKEELGSCIGKHYRAAIVVTDQGLGNAIQSLIE